MIEKRGTPRHRVLKAGTVEFGNGGIDCRVRNLSDSGAALEVASPVGIPESVNLVIAADGLSRRCRVVWRKEKSIGVMFV